MKLALGMMLAGIVAGSTALRAQGEVRPVAEALAAAFEVREAGALERFLPESGIALSLDGTDHRGVGRRQARAALARFLERYDSGTITIARAESLGGAPPRALVELTWATRTAGTPEERSFTIFVSLESGAELWRIREIRVFS